MKLRFFNAKRFFLFITFTFIVNLADSTMNLRPKDLKVENIKLCPIDKNSPIVVDFFDITQPERQKYSLNSTIRILSNIDNNIYFKMNITRCTFSRSKCDDLETTFAPNVCKHLNSPNTLWAPLVKKFQPSLTCPMKAGSYHVENSVFDLGIISRVPIEPGKLLVNLTFFDFSHEEERRKRILVCLACEVTITQAKSGGLGSISRAPRKHKIR